MKPLLTGVGLAFALALLSAFSLLSLGVQTARLRWNSLAVGTVSPSTILGPYFGGSIDPSGGVSYGPASWRAAAVSCTIAGTGSSLDGGTAAVVAIEHEDAGVDGSCDLGLSGCNTLGTFNCVFANGVTELAGTVWHFRYAATSSCSFSSATVFCSSDLLR